MNLIYLRHGSPRARKFIRKKLRGRDSASIYGIRAGDCCLAPASSRRRNYLLTFLNGISAEMLAFMTASRGARPGLN